MYILRLFVNVIKQLVVGQLLEKIGSLDSTIQVWFVSLISSKNNSIKVDGPLYESIEALKKILQKNTLFSFIYIMFGVLKLQIRLMPSIWIYYLISMKIAALRDNLLYWFFLLFPCALKWHIWLMHNPFLWIFHLICMIIF